MRTTREQKEANTVHMNKVQANQKLATQRWHALGAAAGIERDYLWSRPSRFAMPFCLGTQYALGAEQVPV